MSALDTHRSKRQIRPIVSLTIVIAVAILMTGLSFAIFWNSNAKDIVQSLQRIDESTNTSQAVSSGSIDNDGRLTTSELLFLKNGLDTESSRLEPNKDFSSSALNKTTIGF